MSKRSNSIGLRLGSIQTWNFNLNNYNQNFKLFTKLIIEKKYIQFCIWFLFNKLKINANLSKLELYHNLLELNIQYNLLKITKPQNFLHIFTRICKVVNKNFKTSFKLKIFKKKNNLYISYLLSEYIKFRYSLNKNSLKVVFNKIEQDLKNIIKKEVHYYSLKGIKRGNIVGIKLLCKGRLGSIRNPLTQTFVKSLGNVSFLNLTNCIDYTKNLLYTKQGMYSVHIWIFYSNV